VLARRGQIHPEEPGGTGCDFGRWDIMIGPRELFFIGMVVLVLYGRSGVLKTKRAQTILPWLSPVRRSPSRSAGSGRMATASTSTAIPRSASRIPGAFLVRGNRLFWFLTILAATAVAALIIGRTLIMSGRGTTLSP
jgi:hypothetical protein